MTNKQAIKVFLKRKILLAISSFFVFILFFACGSIKQNYIWDYYGEYKYTIDFAYNSASWRGYLQVFSDIGLDEVESQLVQKYTVTRYRAYYASDVNNAIIMNADCLLIMITQNDKNYYFLVDDKKVVYDGNNNKESYNDFFSINDLGYSMYYSDSERYSILFPFHFSAVGKHFDHNYNEQNKSNQVTCTFEELVNFYQNTNRKTIVDYDKQTIIFAGRDSEGRRKKFLGCTISTDYPSVDIQMTYTTNDDGQNFVHFDVIK